MASRALEAQLERPAFAWLLGAVRRTLGVLLLVLGLWLVAAIWGFHPGDPSLDHATGAVAQNPMGMAGAVAADLLLQVVGLSVWILTAALLAWGLRMSLNRPLAWPWLPLVCLPLSLLAASAWLATLHPLPPHGIWPFRVGLGGFVGDFLFARFQPRPGDGLYGWLSATAAVFLGIGALGLRWRESTWAIGRVAGVSAWAGRQMGDAAGRAARASSDLLSRPDDEEEEPQPAPPPPPPSRRRSEPVEEDEGKSRGPFARLGGWILKDNDAAAPAEPSLRRIRPRRAEPEEDELEALPMSVAEEQETPQPSRTLSFAKRTKRAAQGARQSLLASARAPEPATAAPVPAADAEGYALPGLDLLAPPVRLTQARLSKEALEQTARELETVLDDFGVKGEIIDAKPGPVVTLFELQPAPGTRSQRVISLADDIARSLCALSVRVATVPGRNVIGIELPNDARETVYLRDILEHDPWRSSEARLALALGKDISGQPVIVDLSRMPHLLIAGTTGSGKSVAINAMILSLLYRLTPEQCRIIMIDPKVIELSVYEDIPHLLAPVVTEPHKAVVALKWVVRQMDERYRLMSHLGVRDIFAFNRRVLQARARGEQPTRRVRVGFEPGTGSPIIEEQPIDTTPLPLIVVVVDEVADLMLTAGKEIENAIQRLSQKARAAGIHLIVATQRPSVDVITGVIKANLPSRISFRVSSKIDSRTVLGDAGAEQLLGQGDMLYLMPGDRISRVHGALVTDGEVEAVVRHLKAQGAPDYVEDVTREGEGEEGPEDTSSLPGDGSGSGGDAVYNQAVQIVARDGKASTSYLQRKLAIGYNSAAKLIERMEAEGLISHADHVGRRQVLMGRGGVDGNEVTQDY